MYKIKEIENNFIYDDIYKTEEEAEDQIKVYEEDDAESERIVTYTIVELTNGAS